ncbi:hypothetical protein BV22DRAFT_1195311 [Leucogyrophana mollusca]|uniref:Uncharacterized protein n=1 Tax=Leucogyrophana mollusca TaxID=85980 RepID=A0ACB8BH94_9AGAM|nr:hypothetical protein BV22DRAFT_1195311 [Leucogyrophana mollusca]
MFHIIPLFVLWAAGLPLALCGLYPTQPIQDTVYAAGEPVSTTWIDDGTYPNINNLGPLEIQLFCDTDTFITTLVENVNPRAMSQQITIPSDLAYDGSDFSIRFLTDTPYNLTIYTADFTVTTGSNQTDSSESSQSTSPSLSGSSTSSSSKSSPPAYTAPPLRPGDVGFQPGSQQSKNAGRHIDIEKVKFRLVFILWPALIGITMAL